MKGPWIQIHGRRYVSVRTLAEVYEVEESWLVEVSGEGLLGEPEETESGLAVSAEALDRLAEIQRLNRHLGMDLDNVAVWLKSFGL